MYFLDKVEREEWGFYENLKPDELFSDVRYVPFAEVRDWLMQHALNKEDRDRFAGLDYDAVGKKIAEAWVSAVGQTQHMIFTLKKTYDAFLIRSNNP